MRRPHTDLLQQPTAFISAGAFRHNVRLMRERVGPAELMAVIKDNAYGHSQELVLELLRTEGVTRFGTLDLPSSLMVRRTQPEAMIFAWVIDHHDDLADAILSRIDLGVTDPAMLERVAREAALISKTALVHLKLDSGLHRAGTVPEQWPTVVARAAELQRDGVIQVRGLWTHLSEASEQEDSRSIAKFTAAVEIARHAGINADVRHLAASAAAFSRPDARFDMVRVGAFLYGIGPGDGIDADELGLVPVMTLRAPVTNLVERDSRVFAEIAVGGATGILSEAVGTVSVAINSQRYDIASVHPNRTMIDVTGSAVNNGDTATLFGSGASGEATLQEWADAMGTIGEELVCRVSAQIPRILIP